MISAPGPNCLPACRTSFASTEDFTSLLDGLGVELLTLKQESGQHWIASGRHGRTGVLIVRLTGRYRVRMRVPERHILVQFGLGHESTRTLSGVALTGEEIVVGCAPAELDMVLTGPHEGVSLLLGEAALLAALATLAPGLDKLICATPTYVLSGCRHHLGRLTRAALAALEHPHNKSHPQTGLVESVAEVLADAFERTSHARLGEPWFQRRPIVRRVEEFMRSNLGQPITLESVCQVARASRRTVEYAFSATYGMGPKQYLALLRLNEVNRYLKSGSGETILEIAGRYGFQHMGHFSSQYRQLFGETARQTRYRAQCAACRDAPAMTGSTLSPDAVRPQGESVNGNLWPNGRGSELALRGKSMQPLLSAS